ncbi:hypothetical protein PoB_004484400 [Plakobranchus ocellatus]|uniref:Uncharacterized protein n=1 Tax=Plakobranchus ocellatus TaxID=259542 RepID=A0AAV4BHN1_9GAST|nr:hypothetical protein PoB_004484400 [Plakobranchus ocellatus]
MAITHGRCCCRAWAKLRAPFKTVENTPAADLLHRCGRTACQCRPTPFCSRLGVAWDDDVTLKGQDEAQGRGKQISALEKEVTIDLLVAK